MPEISPLNHATAAILDLATALNSLTPLRSTHSSSSQPYSPVDSIISSLQEILQQYSPLSSTTLLPIQRVISPVLEPFATPILIPLLSSPSPLLLAETPNIIFPAHFCASQPPTIPLVTSVYSANFATLNLDTSGQPFHYKSALHGPDRKHWILAELEEFDRLFATQTIIPLLNCGQPPERRKDTTYYNPQVKQKYDENGVVTYRIRCTIGRDRINYPGETAALTAAMPVVKLLLQSAIPVHSTIDSTAKSIPFF